VTAGNRTGAALALDSAVLVRDQYASSEGAAWARLPTICLLSYSKRFLKDADRSALFVFQRMSLNGEFTLRCSTSRD
jgi:hypothetical protein